MVSFNYGIYAYHSGAGAHRLAYSADGQATGNLLEVWDGDDAARQRFAIHSAGDVILGPATAAAIATTATDGFMVIRTCAGAPTGTPTNEDGVKLAMLVYDSTNDELYVRCSGAWVSVALT